MSNFEFLQLFIENTWLFFICLIPVVIFFGWVAHRLTSSWLNPLRFSILTNGIGISVAIFLYFTGNTTLLTFVYVVVSALLFWLILCFRSKKKPDFTNLVISSDKLILQNVFIIIYLLYIGVQLLVYIKLGIPLFNDGSRLTTFVGSGLGFLERMTPFLMNFSIFYILNRFRNRKISKFKLILLFLPIVLFGVLSGSRSSFLQVIFAIWGYYSMYVGKEPTLSKYKGLIIVFIIVSLLTFYLESLNSDGESPIFSFLFRVIGCGDLYWQSMPNDIWKEVVINAPVKDHLVDLFAPMRLISSEGMDKPIGFQLTEIITGTDLMAGPVPLVPIASLIYGGYIGGLLYTAFQALLARFFINSFYKKSNSLIVSAFMYYCFNSTIAFVASIPIGNSSLFNMLFSLLILTIVIFISNILKPV